jgi:transposase InsO family protein
MRPVRQRRLQGRAPGVRHHEFDESAWQLLRQCLYGQRFVTRRQAKDETITWLHWYNKARLHSTLAYVSPMQFESKWLARQVNA